MAVLSIGFYVSDEIEKNDPITTSLLTNNNEPENSNDWTSCLIRRFFHMLGFYDEPLYQHLKSLADEYLKKTFSMFVFPPPSSPYSSQWKEHEVYFYINLISGSFFNSDNIKVVEILAFFRAIRLLLVNKYCCEPFFCARDLADKCERFVTYRLDNHIEKLGGWDRIMNKIKQEMKNSKSKETKDGKSKEMKDSQDIKDSKSS